MKKFLCLALAMLLVLSMVACSGGKKDSLEGLQVGFGRADITPANGTPLAGYGATDTRLSANVLDPLYATCISLYDGKDQVLLITTDVICTYEKFFVDGRAAIAKATGVKENNIFISATHTHCAPDLNYTFDYDNNCFVGPSAEAMTAYMKVWKDGLVASAKDALKDQNPATMSGTKFEAQYLNFVRHYYQEATDSYMGDNFGDGNTATITRYAEEGDKEMVLVKFDRKKGKDVLLCNFQAHPSMNGGATRPDVSADFVGAVRTMMEQQEDVLFAYYTGAAGNQNVKTYLAADNAEAGKVADIVPYSKEFVRQATEAMKAGMTPIKGDDVKVTSQIYSGKVNHLDDDRAAKATELYQEYSKTGNRDASNKKAKEAGFVSIYECGGIMRRSTMAETLDMELNALSVGDLGLITAPYEMFSTNSNAIKAGSPFAFTVVVSCSGIHRSYIPSALMFEKSCYESTAAYYEPGTGELLAEMFVEMLESVK